MLQPEDYYELVCGAEYAVQVGWSASRRSNPSTLPDEVDLTFRLIRWSVRYLAAMWNPILQQRNMSLRMSGVFCHKTPMATFMYEGEKKENRTCELGDLLIVHDHLGPVQSRRAVLMQAKRTDRGVAKSIDDTQNYLYRELPKFSLSRKGYKSSRFKKGDRDIGLATDFARFALVADDAKLCDSLVSSFPIIVTLPAWVVAHPHQDPVTVAGSESFGSFLASMLYDTSPRRGQTATPIPDLNIASLGTGRDLDITVQELLNLTAKRITTDDRSWGGLPRGIVAFQTGSIPVPNPGNPFADLRLLSEAGDAPPESIGEPGDDEGEGLPVLLIETFSDRRD